jgi:hypothetical protein
VNPSDCSVRGAPAAESSGNLGLSIASNSLVASHDGVDGLNSVITSRLQGRSFSAVAFSLPKVIRLAVFDALRHLAVVA